MSWVVCVRNTNGKTMLATLSPQCWSTMINSCPLVPSVSHRWMGLHHAKTLMAPKTLSQSAHSVIMHQFTTASSSRHAAAKMSPLYANVLNVHFLRFPGCGEHLNHPLNTYCDSFRGGLSVPSSAAEGIITSIFPHPPSAPHSVAHGRANRCHSRQWVAFPQRTEWSVPEALRDFPTQLPFFASAAENQSQHTGNYCPMVF